MRVLSGLLVALSATTPGLAQQAAPSIPLAAVPCLSCHGASGRPELADVPIIAGQQEAYLAHALRTYRTGQRDGGQALVMREMVKHLSDEEIEMLAAWFGAQK